MSDTQYKTYLALFNECNEEFWNLSQKTLDAFFDRLYSKK